MIKSAFKLFLIIAMPITILLFYHGPYNPIEIFESKINEPYLVRMFGGNFLLIEQELSNIQSSHLPEKFKSIEAVFGNKLEILELQAARLSYFEKRRILNKNTILLTGEPQRLARLLPDGNSIVIMYIYETEVQQSFRQAKGGMHLLAKRFNDMPQKNWPSLVQYFNSISDLGIQLYESSAIPKITGATKSFVEGNLSWFEFADDSEIFLLVLHNSDKTLKIGPIDSDEQIVNISRLSAAATIIFIIALAILYWLWPVWRNLKSMQRNALAFGKGNLDTRVNVPKNSIVAELGNSFNYMADRIQTLITTNRHLSNAVAHDLKTPLTQLRFALEMLNSNDYTKEEKQLYQDNVEASINSLDHLINQTLTHSHYNRLADIRNFADCRFSDVVYEEFERFQFNHPQLSFKLSIDSNLENSDQFIVKNAMSRVLTNLLSNAVIHANSFIKVSFIIKRNLSQNSGKEVAIRVQDDGPGIPRENRKTVLESFVQLDNIENGDGVGHGLGLAIVNQIAMWHKGKVAIKRSSLGGASVELSWPLLTKPDNKDSLNDDVSVQVIDGF